MNKIEKMIKELCPNGVEWKKLGEVLKYEQPTKYIVKNTDYLDRGIPVLTAGKTFILGYTNENNFYPATKDNPVILFDDFTTAFKWIDFNFKVKSSAVKLLTLIDNKNHIFKYVYYAMQSINYSTMEHSRQWIEKYSNIFIPVPPLEVQAEIVKILDNFTELTNQLTAELTARKKQYEYYRDKLLSFDNILKRGGVVKKLGEVCEFKNGYTPSKSNKAYWTNGNIPWFRMDDIRTNGRILDKSIQYITPQAVKGGKLFKANSIILATTATIGEHALITVDFLANQRFTCLTLKKQEINQLNIKFFYYYMFIVDNWCKDNVNISSFPSVDTHALKKVPIPIPPLEVQGEIVAILDKFESMCNSLSEGLPAEIEARKKQYEYYRDKLLTF